MNRERERKKRDRSNLKGSACSAISMLDSESIAERSAETESWPAAGSENNKDYHSRIGMMGCESQEVVSVAGGPEISHDRGRN